MFANLELLFLATLFTTGACIPGLSLAVHGPAEVDGVHNLKVTATLTNTGNETLKLLNDPRGPLSHIATNTFSILSSSGSKPNFNGVKLKYVPSKIIEMDDDSLFTVLEPGKSVSIDHDLSSAYNFTGSGEGAYSVEARNKFHYVDPKTKKAVAIEAVSQEYKVSSLVGKLAVARSTVSTTAIERRSHPSLSKRTGFAGCNDDQISQVFEAIPAVQKYASSALKYLQSTGNTERYTTWFGQLTKERHDTVTDHYTKLSGNDFPEFVYNCECSQPGVFAYVVPDDFGVVHLCDAFWTAPVSGTDSKGGTILHESSHFTKNGGTDDHAYGHSACQTLAQSDPDQAIDNADSHEYFAENEGPVLQ
ncbi:hypothetical protein V5O48_015184 [Marasmius crinis-equi]|uniref:Lysine-specific metallo-endopeptidase domain-containing protein n=1 Tax=Marasmius crinis-equi TaxID=585013 RepID=A0ABR3EVA1_9AGAR